MLNFGSPRIRRSLGQAALHEPYPSWLLDPYGVVRSANLMAFWLWNRLNHTAVQPDRLVGCNFFDILAANFERIPLYRNIEFYAKQSALLKRAAASQGSSPYASFIAGMLTDPHRARIYTDAAASPERIWEYPLALTVPGGAELLDLRITTYRLEGGDGLLALTTPAAGTLPVMEAQYAQLIMQYGQEGYVISERQDGPPGNFSFLSALSGFYRSYYPTFVQDPLWYIVEENRAQQMLFGAPAVGMHFFELFFAPQLRPWLGPIQETSAPRAMKYFETFTEPLKQEDHELHAAYLQVLQRLAQLPEYRKLVEMTWRARIHIDLPENEEMPFYTCRVFLPWALAPEVTLQFHSMVRYLYKGLLIGSDQRYFQVILVPENYETEAALMLLHLYSGEQEELHPVYRQMLWGLAVLRTIREGLERLDEGQSHWDPESAFARIYRDVENEVQVEGDEGIETITPALRKGLEALNGVMDEEIIFSLLHITATKKSFAGFAAFLEQEHEQALAGPSRGSAAQYT
jgi:hypothetical protein